MTKSTRKAYSGHSPKILKKTQTRKSNSIPIILKPLNRINPTKENLSKTSQKFRASQKAKQFANGY